MSGEFLPPERLQKVPALASSVWMCATFQNDLFASLISTQTAGQTQWALSLSPS